VQHVVRLTAAYALSALSLATASALLSGCAAEETISSVTLPPSVTGAVHGQNGATPPGPAQPGGQSNALVVTSQQRGYLDALRAAGLKPSSDLLALSIGTSVCQAHTAKQSDQAVWDFVLPMVRNDVRYGQRRSMAPEVVPPDPPTAAEVNAATADYIRIASEHLC
jgi:hypothetical protein